MTLSTLGINPHDSFLVVSIEIIVLAHIPIITPFPNQHRTLIALLTILTLNTTWNLPSFVYSQSPTRACHYQGLVAKQDKAQPWIIFVEYTWCRPLIAPLISSHRTKIYSFTNELDRVMSCNAPSTFCPIWGFIYKTHYFCLRSLRISPTQLGLYHDSNTN